jgi:hypothetical protein
MSDTNRGSYGSEPPLAFDRRQKPRGGGPAPITLILSILLLAGVAGGVYFMYRGGARGANDAPRPVGTPLSDVRTVAPPQAAQADPAAGLSIYKDDPNAAPVPPAFVPPPEAPTPRPAPIAAAVAPPAPVPSAPALPAESAAVAAKTPTSAKPHAAKPVTIDKILADGAAAPAPRARADHVKTDLDASDGARKAESTGPAVVQIGAFSSTDLAERSWSKAAGVGGGAMAGKTKHVTPVTKPDGSTVYRTAIGGFASRGDAQALCDRLKASGQTCFVR